MAIACWFLLFHGLSDEITRWAEAKPSVPVHCFCDRPNAPEEEKVRKNLTFHRLHGEKFLRMMAHCRGVVCTAGFESISEAAYLGKPLLMTPVQDHVEQFLNAKDAEKAGLGMCDVTFNLSRLLELRLEQSDADFVKWVDQAEEITLRAIEECARGKVRVKEPALTNVAAGFE